MAHMWILHALNDKGLITRSNHEVDEIWLACACEYNIVSSIIW